MNFDDNLKKSKELKHSLINNFLKHSKDLNFDFIEKKNLSKINVLSFETYEKLKLFLNNNGIENYYVNYVSDFICNFYKIKIDENKNLYCKIDKIEPKKLEKDKFC